MKKVKNANSSDYFYTLAWIAFEFHWKCYENAFFTWQNTNGFCKMSVSAMAGYGAFHTSYTKLTIYILLNWFI